MATLQAPDGTELQIPDGLDAEQVTQIFQAHARNFTRTAARQTLADSSPYEKFGVGVARPFVELGEGVKDLAGKVGIGSGLDDEDRSTLERMSQVTGGAATAGRIVGEGASLLAPGGLVAKAGSLLPRAAARFAIPLADIAANAGTEALKAPTDEESRGQRAITGAEGAVGGQVLGRTLKFLATGIKPYASDIASRFMDEGIPLTPGQAVGGAAQTVEQMLSKLPIVGPAIKARQNEALSAWNLKMLADTANVDTGGTGDLVNAAGPEGFQQATKIFSDAYNFHWDRPLKIDPTKLSVAWKDLVDDTQQRLIPDASNAIQQKLVGIWQNDLIPTINPKTGSIHGTQLQAVDKDLGDAATTAARNGDGDIASFYGRARNDLRAQYPDNFRESLEALNGKYAEFARLRKAGGYVNGPAAGQPFTPAQLLTASTALDRSAGKGATAQGTALMQPQAVDAMSVFPATTNDLASRILDRVIPGGSVLGGSVAALLHPHAILPTLLLSVRCCLIFP